MTYCEKLIGSTLAVTSKEVIQSSTKLSCIDLTPADVNNGSK